MVNRSSSTALHLDLEARSEPTKSLRLQAALREAIRAGRLQADDRLPSSRSLASDLGWARNVVVDAYDQLTAEGYLTAQVGHGTRVTDRLITDREPKAANPVASEPIEPRRPPIQADLQPGLPDLDGFPRGEWRRCLHRALDLTTAGELGYQNGAGSPIARASLAKYLSRTRATDLRWEQVLITTGVSASLRLLAAAVQPAAAQVVVAVEDPGAYNQWGAIRSAGARIEPVPVDEEGIDVDALESSDADIVVVTPAHQYPMGGVLSSKRRTRLVEWARSRRGRVLVEDDYDAEFRYDRRPVGSIQGTASDVTAITSSVSKTLAPGLRLGWVALPTSLIDPVAAWLENEFVTPDVIQQRALAELIDSGRYDRIIRTRRKTYRERRSRMVSRLNETEGCRVIGAAGGLHLTVLLPGGVNDREVSSRLLDLGVDVPPLDHYRIRPGPPGLVASFSAASDRAIDMFARCLAEVLSTVR